MDKTMEELKRMICKELEEVADKGEMSAGDLDVIHKLVVTKEKILRIEEIEDQMGYSGREQEWGAYDSGYDRNSAYRRSGRPYARNSMSSYSRAADDIRKRMTDMLNSGEFTSSQRMAVQRVMDEV